MVCCGSSLSLCSTGWSKYEPTVIDLASRETHPFTTSHVSIKDSGLSSALNIRATFIVPMEAGLRLIGTDSDID